MLHIWNSTFEAIAEVSNDHKNCPCSCNCYVEQIARILQETKCALRRAVRCLLYTSVRPALLAGRGKGEQMRKLLSCRFDIDTTLPMRTEMDWLIYNLSLIHI